MRDFLGKETAIGSTHLEQIPCVQECLQQYHTIEILPEKFPVLQREYLFGVTFVKPFCCNFLRLMKLLFVHLKMHHNNLNILKRKLQTAIWLFSLSILYQFKTQKDLNCFKAVLHVFMSCLAKLWLFG